MLDAGSSGTRAYVYQWETVAAGQVADVKLATGWSLKAKKAKIEPGR